MKASKVKMVQVVVAPWQDQETKIMSYSLFALGSDGVVYKCTTRRGDWVPLSMERLDD